jgi:hypothetical protein
MKALTPEEAPHPWRTLYSQVIFESRWFRLR